jgi:hypothetical protein
VSDDAGALVDDVPLTEPVVLAVSLDAVWLDDELTDVADVKLVALAVVDNIDPVAVFETVDELDLAADAGSVVPH